MQLFRILFCCTFVLLSCNSNKTPEDLKARFYKNKFKLDEFVTILKTDKTIDSILSNRTAEQGWTFNDLQKEYPKVYELLNSIGITEASSHKNSSGKRNKWYFLKTNWLNEYPIYLTYDRLDSINTVKGYYNKDEVSNETWGLGDNWYMFLWIKDKPYKQ
jgi:hypothetical protein